MPDVLTGNPSNVTTPLSATITALANNGSGAVRVTVSAPDLFGPNDRVLINTSVLSGIFAITVIDSTHFDLQGSVFTTTSTGTAVDMSLTPQIQVPTDGDPESMQIAGMLSALQGILDRTQFLKAQIDLSNAGLVGGTRVVCTQSTTSSTVLAVTANGAPAELQTTAAHQLVTGMWVNIVNALGDTAINGNWPVTVVDSTHFTIPVQGSGSYTASSATVTTIVPPGVNWILCRGFGGGGGGEGGGGAARLNDVANNNEYPNVQGGGGQGAPLTIDLIAATPLGPLTVVVGGGGAGGVGGGASPATAGATGAASTANAGGATLTMVPGIGAGVGEDPFHIQDVIMGSPEVPNGAALVAPGATLRAHAFPPWPQAFRDFAALGSAPKSNVGNVLPQGPGDGGAAVVWTTGFAYSTGGTDQLGNLGGTAGTPGASHGSSPQYLGGPGGGGGGAGVHGPGGNGGNGSDANASGNSSNGGDAPNTFSSPGNTGAGGGGGGTAGAASGTMGTGGAGAAGDSGRVTLYWVQVIP